ncbi:hypothetical protein [Serratia proteamaculans]|uniref:hypothetical protein n=1 Tax=Serratia proteamaculans TaxID=28151 RepID=UPI00217BD9F7|nr:hypothetical protein [Serratia proteamaculans]CAI1755727.1 Uncharacterised protein [Serratia proteamaculans]
MQKVGNTTDTADANGEYTNGNVAQGIPPTIINAEMLNTFQRELVNVVEGAGITLNPESNNQIYLAIKKLTEGDGFLSKSKNLSDVESITESRSNLQIYSKVESDNKFANINGNQNFDFYVRDNGDATAAVNNARLNSTLQGYAWRGGDASRGFAVSGGTEPNSAVAFNQFQSGDNGNGAWTKLPGGGQWCRKNTTIPKKGSLKWTYPLAFPDVPAIFISGINGQPNVWFAGIGSASSDIYNDNDADLNVNVLAIW